LQTAVVIKERETKSEVRSLVSFWMNYYRCAVATGTQEGGGGEATFQRSTESKGRILNRPGMERNYRISSGVELSRKSVD